MNNKHAFKLVLTTMLGVGTILVGTFVPNEVHAANSHYSIAHTAIQKENHTALLDQTKELATKGKVVTSEEFGIYSTQKAIENKWGKADKNSPEGELRYSKRSTAFYLDKFDTPTEAVYLLKTTDKRYANISYSEVKKRLGKGSEYKGNDSAHISYDAKDYALTFYFPVDKQGKIGNVKSVEVSVH
jgi:hypothetical protein